MKSRQNTSLCTSHNLCIQNRPLNYKADISSKILSVLCTVNLSQTYLVILLVPWNKNDKESEDAAAGKITLRLSDLPLGNWILVLEKEIMCPSLTQPPWDVGHSCKTEFQKCKFETLAGHPSVWLKNCQHKELQMKFWRGRHALNMSYSVCGLLTFRF